MSAIIAITGPAGSGKSTIASMIENRIPGQVMLCAFAQPIKDFLHEVFSIPKENLYGTSDKREELIAVDWDRSCDRLWSRGVSYLASWGHDFSKARDELGVWFDEVKTESMLGRSNVPKISARRLAQTFGTDYARRKLGSEIWLNVAKQTMDASPAPVKVITDLRFDNEAKFIRALGGRVWEVVPRNSRLKALTHESERGVDHRLVDSKIPNFGSLEALRQTVDEHLNMLGLIGE